MLTRLATLPLIAAFKAMEDEEVISARLESIISLALQAVNARNFDPDSIAWAEFSRDFHNDPDGPAFQQFVAARQQVCENVGKPRNLVEFLAVHQDVSSRNPAYELKALSLHTTTVNLKVGFAQVLMIGEATGIPAGVVRRTISAFEFRFIDGKWWCVNNKTLPGMDTSCGPSGN